MYTLTRKRDNLIFEMNNFKNVRCKLDGTVLTDFPPEVGCSMIAYSSIGNSWRTTIIKSIEKINDNEYIVHTKNSTYNVKRKIAD